MNKSVSSLIRLFALALLVVMALSLISCDKLPFGNIFGDKDNGDDQTPECQHYNIIDSKCIDCGTLFYSTVEQLMTEGASLASGSVSTQYYYVKATVKQVINTTTGEMIIEDATGAITVCALCSSDGTTYANMEAKPDEADELTLLCTLTRNGDEVKIKVGSLIDYKAVEAPEKPIETITIAEAIEICKVNAEETAERYYIRATITRVSNPMYGEMYIADETGELLVYNTKNSDGTIGYSDMTERPVKGDEVLLYCTLNNHNGTNQVKSAWVIEFTHNEPEYDPSQYTEMTLAEAREATTGTKVKVSGVVAQITYANGHKPSGVILVDGTNSIYVYDGDIAGQVKVGNTVTIAGEKTYWILDSETNNAAKFGYTGSCQIESVTLLANDNGNNDFDKSWITETTVKDIMDTPVTENITNQIFKVTALVKKAPGNGFVNYYIDDLDGVTGSYVYTQCNGGDFSWLDPFDGKFCTVYFVAINAKSTSTGCTWRFLPVEVIDEGYEFDVNDAAEYVVKYHGVTQFLSSYTGDPAAELSAQISSELLGFEGATLSYTSSNERVVYFTTDTPGTVTFHCGAAGTATVTITGSYNGNTYSESIEITVAANENVEYISVADAIASDDDSIVTVKGIVGPSVVNRNAFYLFGEDGSVISVLVKSVDIFSEIEIGHEIIITGKREHFVNADKYNGNYVGQATIVDAEVVANYYGNHEYSTEKFVTDKTVEDLRNLDIKTDYSTTVFVVDAVVSVQESAYYTNIKLLSTDGKIDITLYCSSANQYSWLKAYAGQTVTLELAGCNWNDKTYWTFCALAVVNEDGTKVLNTLNFN